MAALDGLIVRVKPFVRGLSAADLQCIAAAAERAGAGALELTARGALQIRGLDKAGAEMFACAMVEAGLASADAAAERRRNIQLGLGCRSSLLSFAGALESWLEEDASLSALPAKFGFAVSPAESIAADIVVLGEDESHILIGGDTAVSVSAAPLTSAFPGLVPGTHSATFPPPTGPQTSRRGPPEQVRGRREEGNGAALDAVQRLTRAFLRLAPLQPTPPRRMKGLIQAVGLAAVLAEAGLTQAEPPYPQPRRATVGPSHNGYGLGVVFGVLTPAALRTAAELAMRYGDGQILLAPGRVIWLGGVSPSANARLADDASAAGFVIDPHDRRLRLNACVGAAGCARASEDVRAAALRLASAAPPTGLHVSGCAKGCAHPSAAGVTLVSRGGGGRYDLILDGAPSAPATRTDVSLDAVAEHLSEPAL
jgi:sulfite reductase beta subunit-like hemoprotein